MRLGQERKLFQIKDTRIHYIYQDKEYDLSPEEWIRMAIFVELIEDYNYSPNRLGLEVPVPRRVPCDFADIVIFVDDRHMDNYLVIECKSGSINDHEYSVAIEQGFGNANSLRARYLIIDNGDRREIYDVANFPPNERTGNKIHDIPTNYGLTYNYRFVRQSSNDLQIVSFSSLVSVFKKCHDIIWSGGKLDPAVAFDEMSKILFAKIEDERNTSNGDPYKIQFGQNENEVIVGKRCIEKYNDARRADSYVFTDPISLPYGKVLEVVKIIQHINLSETDIDAKGQAFEQFLSVIFRGGLGQYFTRRQIVEFMTHLLEPSEKDIVLDPSCGSGGFLLYSLKVVSEAIRKNYSGNDKLIERKIYDFTRKRVFGIEINEKIARVAMMDMIVNDDGHTNIECNTGLNNIYKNEGIKYGRFTLILTNPPFGVDIKKDDRDKLGSNNFQNFLFGASKKSQESDIMFLEQYERFLVNDDKLNPRLGVVLQTGVLNNPSNSSVLDWIKLKFKILAVVALPGYAFRKAGSGMKTSLLFLRKYKENYTQPQQIPDYEIMFAIADHIGYDATLRPDINDLPNILAHYLRRTEDRNNKVLRVAYSQLDYRLDAQYYYNKYLIGNIIHDYTSRGHIMKRLSYFIDDLSAGKSPLGGVTRCVGEYPSITISNITQSGQFDFSNDLNFVPQDYYDQFRLSKPDLTVNSILIAKDGATTGKSAIIDNYFPFIEDNDGLAQVKAIYSEHIFHLTVKSAYDPIFVHAFLNSSFGKLQMETVITGGAQGGITSGFMDNIVIPLLSIDSQREIAASWKIGMSEIRQLRESANQSEEKIIRELDNLMLELK